MGLKPYDNLILAHANLVNYWPLDGDLVDAKGGNNLTGTNGWTKGPIGSQAALLDGINQQLQSTAAIDLTGTNKVTLEMMIQWIVYDTTNIEVIAELSADIGVNPGFSLNSQGTIANDPLGLSCKTNVGINNALHNYPANGIVARYWRHYAMLYDIAQAISEPSLYINGVARTRESQTAANNNTANFPNTKLYFGSRGGVSSFANIAASNIALYNTTLSDSDIMAHAQLAIPRKRHCR